MTYSHSGFSSICLLLRGCLRQNHNVRNFNMEGYGLDFNYEEDMNALEVSMIQQIVI